MSSISDLEVEVEDTPGTLYYVRYPLEPLAGEARARATSPSPRRGRRRSWAIPPSPSIPNDERYRDLVGRYAILPIMERRIPIIADEAVEQAFGTGAVKVTPAHDPTDFEIGNRHNLERIQVIGFDAKMTEKPPARSPGRIATRRARASSPSSSGWACWRSEEDYEIPLGYCQRCHTIIEPLISMQWFVKMTPLATGALGALKYGQTADRAGALHQDLHATGWRTSATGTSRASSGGDIASPPGTATTCGEITVAREDPTACAHCGSAAASSRTPTCWIPGSARGSGRSARSAGPTTPPDLRRYYPTSVLETGYDIIFFWVARMVMAGIHFLGVVPFHTIYLHGLVRDEQGRKMSKSLGNVIDPIEVMDEYGTDALRFTLATSSTPGQRHQAGSVTRIVGNRNFANKIWNAARFVIGQTEAIGGGIPALETLQPQDAGRPLDRQPGAAT